MEERFRVKVDASAGVVEVEGPEAFVREMLDRYDSLTQSPLGKRGRRKARRKAAEKAGDAKRAGEVARPRKGRAGAVEADKELMDKLEGRRTDLAAYLDERRVTSQPEEAAIIASFLASRLDSPSMNESQYVAALRTLGRRLPRHPRQVLLNAKNRNQFFYDDDSSFRLTNAGINFAEHDSLKGGASD
jgi:hypothetical protein